MKHFMNAFLLITAWGWTLPAAGADPDSLMEQANQNYTAGKYKQAAGLYIQVQEAGYESATLYYNMGNAFYKCGMMPQAILYYEKSLKLNPNDEKTKFNLKVANSKIPDKIEALPLPFYRQWWIGFSNTLGPVAGAIAGIALLFVFFVLLAVYLLPFAVRIRKTAFISAIPALLFSLVFLYSAWWQNNNLISNSEAIVFDASVSVKSSPDAASQDLFVIHEGTRVSINDQIGEWIEIRIANGADGWIPGSAVQKI